MAKKGSNTLLYAGIGIGAYLLLTNSGVVSSVLPAAATTSTGTTAALTTAAQMIGINTGVRGNGGTGVYMASNYAQLLASDPNLGNPEYTFTAAQNAQYLANYLDLQQALPTWVGLTMYDPKVGKNVKVPGLSYAVNLHWRIYGCAEQRIYYPLQPPSNVPYTPPPAVAKSSGSSSVLSTGLAVAAKVLPLAVALLGPGESDPQLNDADLQLLFTGGGILKNIVPMFMQSDPQLATQVDQHFTALLTPYYS